MSPQPRPGQAPRDLREIARSVAENPTVGKRILRSRAMRSHRRAVQSKGAMASYALSGLQKVVSFGFGQIPVPVVGNVADKAWSYANDKAREARLGHNRAMAVSSSDKVKFSLKAIGGEMADLDNHRWKIAHAIEQCNKAEADQSRPPCDQVVRLWAKRKYLTRRIEKLEANLLAMQGVIDATKEWLEEVKASGNLKTEQELTQQASSHLQNLRNADHGEGREEFCMFGTKSWTSQKSVPTSEFADFFVKAAGEVSAAALTDPVGDALGEI